MYTNACNRKKKNLTKHNPTQAALNLKKKSTLKLPNLEIQTLKNKFNMNLRKCQLTVVQGEGFNEHCSHSYKTTVKGKAVRLYRMKTFTTSTVTTAPSVTSAQNTDK
jgi:anthranilate/para-aminobenzoate synthase component I